MSIFGFSRTVTTAVALAALILLSTTAPSFSEWRKEIGVFRIGIVNQGTNASARKRLEPFRQSVADVLDMDVELFPTASGEQLIEALSKGRIEYAVLSASGYALAWTLCKCVEPLVIPRAYDSTDSYHLIALAKFGKGITLKDISRKKSAILSKRSVTGEALVKHLLGSSNPEVDISNVRLQSLATSAETQAAFQNGEFDILYGWSSLTGDPSSGYSRGTLRDLVDPSSGNRARYEVVWKSKPIPHRPHVIRNNIAREAKQLLADMLTELFEKNPRAYDSIEPVYGGGFNTTRHDRFELLLDYFSTFEKEKAGLLDPPKASQ